MNETLNNIQDYLSDVLPQLGSIFRQIFQRIGDFFSYLFGSLTDGSVPLGDIYTGVIRWVMPILAIHILFSVLRSMLRVRNPKETWGYLTSADLGRFPIHHWECTVGRANHCDVIIKFATISKTHCSLMRNDEGEWTIHNLSDKNITRLNGEDVTEDTPLHHGDIIEIGGVELKFEAITELEYEQEKVRRMRKSRPLPPWTSFLFITIFQVLTVIQLFISKPEIRQETAVSFGILCAVMWAYVLISRAFGKTGFEPEILAFFACTLNLAVTATALSDAMLKQSLAIVLGVVIFLALGIYLRDLDRVVRTRHLMGAAAVILLLVNLVFSEVSHGARNWISLFGVSLQPSELTKICFIFAGAATLDRLFEKRNLIGFMCLSGFCLLALAAMSDFGTASIFFVTFLVIAFLRSGDFATLSLITGGVAGAVFLVLRFKPYVADRFSVCMSGIRQYRRLSAGAHHVGCRKRRTDRCRSRKRMASQYLRFGNRSGIRRSGRGMGADHRTAGGSVYYHAVHLRIPRRSDRPFRLLYYRSLCRHLSAGLSDDAQRLRICGYSSAYRRDVSVYLLRRIEYDRFLGPSGLPESSGHPSECQLRRS